MLSIPTRTEIDSGLHNIQSLLSDESEIKSVLDSIRERHKKTMMTDNDFERSEYVCVELMKVIKTYKDRISCMCCSECNDYQIRFARNADMDLGEWIEKYSETFRYYYDKGYRLDMLEKLTMGRVENF